MPTQRPDRGFTLIELVIGLMLVSVLAVMAAPLLRLPLSAWLDASRRADLGRSLLTVQSKLEDDLQRALPGSVRIRQIGPRVLLETLEVRAWGRHRAGLAGTAPVCPATCAAAGNHDALETACNETCFTSLGGLQGDPPQPGDWIVVNPQGPGVVGGDPYFGGNAAAVGGIKTRLLASNAVAEGQRLQIGLHRFAALAADRRFWVVTTPVSWDCNPTTRQLTRRWGYPVTAAQPAAFGAGVASAPLATDVAACTISHVTTARGGIVHFSLRLAQVAVDTQVAESTQLSLQLPVGFDR